MIPTYNCASYLEATLRSVLAQDPGPEAMQIEVVDDHSTADDPEDVVARLGGGRVDFHRQPENVGVVGNLNTCLQRSRGELVHLLHGDDLVLEGFYRTLDERLREHPDAGAAYCRHLYVDEDGRRVDVAPLEPSASGILAEGARFLAAEQRIMTPCIVVRRSVYEELGGFDDRLACAEDWEMWVRVACALPRVLRGAAACLLPAARRFEHGPEPAEWAKPRPHAAGDRALRGLLRAGRAARRQASRILPVRRVGARDGAELPVAG